MKRILVIFLALTGSSSVLARIGESEQQIEHRYGRHIRESSGGNAVTREYHFSGILVTVLSVGGKSAQESYKKLDGGEFSEKEINGFSNVNGGRHFVWDRIDGPDMDHPTWRRNADGARMVYSVSERTLYIYGREQWERLHGPARR